MEEKKSLHLIECMLNKIEREEIQSEWNLSYMSSIFNKEDKNLTNNYRGISVISSISRIVSAVIKGKIEQHLDNYGE